MNNVENLDNLLELVKELGYEVRYECLGGAAGGPCQIGNRKVLFLDLSQSVVEHLEVVHDLLDQEPLGRIGRGRSQSIRRSDAA